MKNNFIGHKNSISTKSLLLGLLGVLGMTVLFFSCCLNSGTALNLQPISQKPASEEQKTPDTASSESENLEQLAESEISYDLLKTTALKSCLKCHSKGDNDISTPEKLLSLSDDVIDEIETDSMPPKKSKYRALNLCEKEIIKSWIEAEKNNQTKNINKIKKVKDLESCQNLGQNQQTPPSKNESPDLNQLKPNFTNIKKEIFANKCFSCHSVDKNNGFTVLEYMDGIQYLGLLAPTAEESRLYKSVTTTEPTTQMPPPDSGIEPLTDNELKFLKKWIDLGADPE